MSFSPRVDADGFLVHCLACKQALFIGDPDDYHRGCLAAGGGQFEKPPERTGPAHFECSICGETSAHVGSHTRLCDPCWELKKRLEDKRRVAAFQIARVELVPGNTTLWRPLTPTTRLFINGVDIGITLGAGQGIEETIREALKNKVTT